MSTLILLTGLFLMLTSLIGNYFFTMSIEEQYRFLLLSIIDILVAIYLKIQEINNESNNGSRNS